MMNGASEFDTLKVIAISGFAACVFLLSFLCFLRTILLMRYYGYEIWDLSWRTVGFKEEVLLPTPFTMKGDEKDKLRKYLNWHSRLYWLCVIFTGCFVSILLFKQFA